MRISEIQADYINMIEARLEELDLATTKQRFGLDNPQHLSQSDLSKPLCKGKGERSGTWP